MKENVVEIKGHKYRYGYKDGDTIYMGPVGDGPSLSEEEFTKAMMASPLTEDQWENLVKRALTSKNKIFDLELEEEEQKDKLNEVGRKLKQEEDLMREFEREIWEHERGTSYRAEEMKESMEKSLGQAYVERNKLDRQVKIERRNLQNIREDMKKEEQILYGYYMRVFKKHEDPDHWKNPIPMIKAPTRRALYLARDAITHVHGGVEIDWETEEFWSEGYNVYTGEIP